MPHVATSASIYKFIQLYQQQCKIATIVSKHPALPKRRLIKIGVSTVALYWPLVQTSKKNLQHAQITLLYLSVSMKTWWRHDRPQFTINMGIDLTTKNKEYWIRAILIIFLIFTFKVAPSWGDFPANRRKKERSEPPSLVTGSKKWTKSSKAITNKRKKESHQARLSNILATCSASAIQQFCTSIDSTEATTRSREEH